MQSLSARVRLRALIFSVLILAAWQGAASAASVLDFRATPGLFDGARSFTATINGGTLDGVQAQFSNPRLDVSVFGQPEDSGRAQFATRSNGLGGLFIGSGLATGIFEVTFDQTVVWTSGTFQAFNVAGIQIDGEGVSTLAIRFNVIPPNFVFAQPLTFLAGETYIFDGKNTIGRDLAPLGFYEFQTWEFAAPAEIPLPGAAWLFISAIAGLTALRYRTKR